MSGVGEGAGCRFEVWVERRAVDDDAFDFQCYLEGEADRIAAKHGMTRRGLVEVVMRNDEKGELGEYVFLLVRFDWEPSVDHRSPVGARED